AGAPIFYSWPSQGSVSSYTIDENNAQWTVAHLKKFLTQVAEQSGAERVNLIAHSMGNRALTRALQALSYRAAADRPTFHNVILTAPDIDAEVFRRDIAPRIVNTARRVTLYASSNDKALAYSKSVHGFPRAGDSGRDLLVIPGIDTIDVSAINKSLLGHSYYGSNDTVLADLNELLHDGRPPERRTWLRPQMLGEQRYWVFEPRAATAALPGAAGG
ncbi:MAG: alpha/beta hydrolase, partial [Candidatus Nealsonbacteria bacterium]|nr:alpha/beta hydrolase [Candidatus Nealsonbacteria bacterium]